MTIHGKITKGFLKLFIMTLCLFLSIVSLVACSNSTEKNNEKTSGNKQDIPGKDTEIKGEEQGEGDTKLTRIAFEKNNKIYLYDEINKQIKSLGDDSKSKDLLDLSPNKTKMVFRYFDEEKAIYPPHIIIYDIKDESLTDIVIHNKSTQKIMELKWIDNENILVTGHINPSSSGYAVYNIESGEPLMSCIGTIRDVDIEKENILYSNTPHIFPVPKANLYINGNKVFEMDNYKEEISEGALSKDGKLLAFRSWVESEDSSKDEVNSYINIAKISSDGKTVGDIKKVMVGSDVTGYIKFDNKNNINIIGDEFIYKLKSGNLIKEQNTLAKQVELSTNQLEQFKGVLAKQFPEDFISEDTLLEDIDIYNIIAF